MFAKIDIGFKKILSQYENKTREGAFCANTPQKQKKRQSKPEKMNLVLLFFIQFTIRSKAKLNYLESESDFFSKNCQYFSQKCQILNNNSPLQPPHSAMC